jgi:DNA-binding transcriptional LysR family regulator
VALAKLRHHFGDPLFVRMAGNMEPTPFSEGLINPVREVLGALETVLTYRDDFDPAHSDRSFRICMTDISQMVLLPRLWETLRYEARGIRIVVIPLTTDSAGLLEQGDADLAIGVMPGVDYGFYQQSLFQQSFFCMLGKDHPRIQTTLSLEQYEAEDHAVISSSGSTPSIVDAEIAKLGIKRRVALEIPNFFGAAFVAESTDLLVTIPQRLGEILGARGAFRTLPVPFHIPEYSVKQYWHERYNNDAGNRWLRGVIARLLSDLPPLTASV